MKTTTPFSKALSFIEAKLQQVNGIKKPQLKFLSTLFEVMWTVPHRINFLNMGRFSSLSEQTFRIEFLIRDAKQHGGLEDCQARDEQKLHYHFNMALGSVSTAKLTMWATLKNKEEVPFSMHNIKQYFYNKYLTETIFANLDLDLSCRKINRLYHQCLDIGRIVA